MTISTMKELDEAISNGWIMFEMTNKRDADPDIVLHDTDNCMYYDTKRGWTKNPPKKWKKIIPTKDLEHVIDRRVMFDFDFWDHSTVYFLSYVWRKSPVTGQLSDPEWEMRAVASFDDFGEKDDSYSIFLLNEKEVEEVYELDELINYIKYDSDEYTFNVRGMVTNPDKLNEMSGNFIDYATISVGYNAGISTFSKESKAVRLASRIGEYRDIGLSELTNLMWTMVVMANRDNTYRSQLIEKLLSLKAYRGLDEYIKKKELHIVDEHTLLTSGFDRLNISEAMYNNGSLRMFEYLAYINKEAEEKGGIDAINRYLDAAKVKGLTLWTADSVQADIGRAYNQIKRGKSVSQAFVELTGTAKTA